MSNPKNNNLTHEQGLIVRIPANSVNAAQLWNDKAGFTVIAVQAIVGKLESETPLGDYVVERKEESLWQRFFRSNEKRTDLVYYAIDTRRRSYEFTKEHQSADGKYIISTEVRCEFKIHNPRQAALEGHDSLQELV